MMPPNSAGEQATMSEKQQPPRQDEPVVTEER